MSESLVSFQHRDGVALLTLDDGKANALNHALLDALSAALDRAEREADAVVIAGRPGRFSAGFDLAIMQSGLDGLRQLVGAGADLMLRLFLFPKPVVLACTGHALAAGAVMLLVGDYRFGVRGAFKLGLNEVAIGLPLPSFAVSFARHRLSKRHFEQATLLARIYSPDESVDVGYLDQVVEPDALLDEAVAKAAALAAYPSAAYALTKRGTRGALADEIRRDFAENLQALTGFAQA